MAQKGTWKCGDCGITFPTTIEGDYEYGVCPHCKVLKVFDRKKKIVYLLGDVQAFYLEQIIKERIIPIDQVITHNWNKPLNASRRRKVP